MNSKDKEMYLNYHKPLAQPDLDLSKITKIEDLPDDIFNATLDSKLFNSILNEFEKGTIQQDYRFDVAVDSKLRKHVENLFVEKALNEKICYDPSHEPPTHLFIPNGEFYVHKCPSCGREMVLRGMNFK